MDFGALKCEFFLGTPCPKSTRKPPTTQQGARGKTHPAKHLAAAPAPKLQGTQATHNQRHPAAAAWPAREKARIVFKGLDCNWLDFGVLKV